VKKVVFIGLFTICIFLPTWAGEAKSSILQVGSDKGGNIGKHLTWLSADSVGIQEALLLLQNGSFNTYDDEVLNLGFGSHAYWIHVTLENIDTAKQTFLWSFYRCGIAVSLFKIDVSLNAEFLDSASIFLPIDSRPYLSRALSFPIQLNPKEKTSLLALVRLINIDNMRIPMDVYAEQKWIQKEFKFTSMIMRFIGLFMFVALLNLFIFLLFKKKLYFWQFVHVLSLTIFNINEFFMEVYFIPENVFTRWAFIPRTSWALLGTLSMVQVFVLFTDLKSLAPRLSKLFKTLSVLLVLSIVQLLLFNYFFARQNPTILQSSLAQFSRGLPGLFMVVSLLLLFTLPIYLYRYASYKVKLYFLSLFVMLIGAGFYMLNFNGYTNFTLYYPGNILVGHTFEIVTFTFILVYGFFEERNEKIELLSKQVALQNRMTRDVVLAQEQERKRIAQELHDGMAGKLGALRFYINSLMRRAQNTRDHQLDEAVFDKVENELKESIEEIRSISHNLMPVDFSKISFTELIQKHIALFSSKKGLDVASDITNDLNNQSQLLQLSLYRIISELINNIYKHAQASNAKIVCKKEAESILLSVEDNGIGFKELDVNPGIGLQNIRSRVSLLKGHIEIKNEKGKTGVYIKIPVENEK
jgi:signal transduction histidine kinase